MNSYKPQRSVLYVPSSNSRAIDKSASIDADWLVFDLEDSVAPQDKKAARIALEKVFDKRNFGRSQVAIRSNAVNTIDFSEDIKTVVLCNPEAILLPKVSAAEDIDSFARLARSNNMDTSVCTWLMIETASGIFKLDDIVTSATRIPWQLHSLVVGHNDIASETGVSLDAERQYLMSWLMQIILQAKHSGVAVLDSVWNKFKDIDGFEREAQQACKMGFDGKTLIHPSQVQIANRIFTPSDAEIARARSIINAFELSGNKGSNVINLDGEMIERLHLQQALKLMAKAQA